MMQETKPQCWGRQQSKFNNPGYNCGGCSHQDSCIATYFEEPPPPPSIVVQGQPHPIINETVVAMILDDEIGVIVFTKEGGTYAFVGASAIIPMP